MSEFPVPLDNLIAYVKTLHPDGEPLENVSDAFAVSAWLDEESDALIGYFVDQARRSGASWSQIGAAMGVSKQAAQKRFVPSQSGVLSEGTKASSRVTDRAARVIAAAGRLAAGQPVGTAHLAAALFTEPDGLAAKAFAAAGLSPEQVYAAVGAGPARAVPDADKSALRELGLDEAGNVAVKDALTWALRLGHNYIGTEHLLLGLLTAPGPAADALPPLGLTLERAEELIAAEVGAVQARRNAAG